MVINVEGQLSTNLDYYIPQRGLYYCSRLISSQKEDEFTGMNFKDLKKVYSIWICPCATGNMKNTITRYEINQVNSYGNYSIPKEDYQLLEVIVVGLDLKSEDKIDEHILDFLTTLFTDKLNSKEKLTTLINEYDIPVNEKMREEIEDMEDQYTEFVEYMIKNLDDKTIERVMANADKARYRNKIRDFAYKSKCKGLERSLTSYLTIEAFSENDLGISEEDIVDLVDYIYDDTTNIPYKPLIFGKH